MKASELRKRELAQIHIGKAQIGMDDDTYRDMLWTVARVRSSADLDWTGRKRVLEHLASRGAKLGYKGKPKRPALDRKALLSKIEAQLADMGLPWAYAHGMAQHMFQGIEKIEWCNPGQLHKIVAALAYKQKKANHD